jgi:hypothetical protein
MTETPLSPIQRVVNSVWKAVRMLEDRPAPPPKGKLHGRRGYGDADIPAPDRPLKATNPSSVRKHGGAVHAREHLEHSALLCHRHQPKPHLVGMASGLLP